MPRRALVMIASTVLSIAAALGVATAAHAAAYRYWTYWQGGSGTWVFASAGPASVIPDDGSVEGWSFAITTTAGSAEDAPSIAPSFDAICGATSPQAGSKRVALVVDPGSAEDAPTGQRPPSPISTCIVADEDATGYQVLRTAATVRTDKGLVCAVDNYPAGECAQIVDDPTTAAGAGTSPGSVTVGAQLSEPNSGAPWITAGVIAVIAVVGFVLWRRRRA
jgi:hypothetical protein